MFLKCRRFALASVAILPVVVGLSVVSAGATSGAALKAVAVNVEPLATGDKTNLIGSGATVVYSPNKLTGLTAVSSANCSATDYTFLLDNKTTKAQTLTSGGVSIGIKVPADSKYAICAVAEGKYKLGLKSSPPAELKVSVTS